MTEPNQWLPAPISQPAPPSVHPPMTGVPPVLVTVADITVIPGMIITPSGQFPLPGAIWTATDNSHQQKRIPGWAIALALIFLAPTCGFSLLLLMVSETNLSGHIEVTVANAGRFHQTSIPVNGSGTFADITARISYARTVSR